MKIGFFGFLFVLSAAVFTHMSYAAQNTANNNIHYEIVYDGAEREEIAGRMEALFEAYNRLFMFDPAAAAVPMKVRVFNNTKMYGDYVKSRLGPAAPGAVYLHYAQRDRRELVIDLGNEEQALPYQAFIQFFRSFVSQPPAWMLEGFAVFFSGLSFTDGGELVNRENLAWLQTARKIKARPGDILTAEGYPEPASAALSWSLASFFVNSGNDEYMRSLTDSFMTLSNSATAAENAQAVMKRILLGSGEEKLTRDYHSYLESRKTFTELVTEGQKAYSAGNRAGSELLFREAMEMEEAHPIPYYYLGLIAYDSRDFGAARQYYLAGIVREGGDQALILYSLGLNAAAAGNNAEAADFLKRAGQAAPDRYRTKTENILSRLGK